MLEWVNAGGARGGCLKVTRTGPGEVYLVAPAVFYGDWRTASGSARNRYTISLQSTTQGTRPMRIEVTGPGGPTWRETSYAAPYAGTWGAQGIGLTNDPPFDTVTGFRIRMGTNPSIPVGEVMLIDNISIQSCAVNLDGSTGRPLMTANDFVAFLTSWAAEDSRAEFDGYPWQCSE